MGLVIPARFNGPDESANGGYTAGLLAAQVGATPGGTAAMVTLRAPPPLQTPLATVSDDAGLVRVWHGDTLVAEAARTSLEVDAVPAVPYETALAAQQHYPGLRSHPFPRCFVCGPARQPGDGMRLFAGLIGDGRSACTWTPHASLADADGVVAPEFVWASLDCPGAWTVDLEGRPLVLGRLTAQVHALPHVGEPCVVVGRLLGAEGRKVWTTTTTYDSSGRELGRAHATWVAITVPSRS
jgi:hypothetical protein